MYNDMNMFSTILRVIWRVVIFIIGASIVWFTVFTVYPYADARLPAGIVFLVLYCLFAYFVIPTLIRLFRVFIKPNHIPLYATTGDGWPADPVNIAVVARSKEQLIEAMEEAGWYLADRATFKNSLRELYSIVFNRPYPRAPFSNLYLLNQPFDLGFQKPANDKMSARSRHHVRFWEFEASDIKGKNLHPHITFWQGHFGHLFPFEKRVWIGAAIDDTGPIGIRWRYGQLTHKNDLDTNKERDLIISDLKSVRRVKTVEVVQAGKPFTFRGQTLGNTFLCDGTIKVVGLKTPLLAALNAKRGSKKE